jgi:hypothetical protein
MDEMRKKIVKQNLKDSDHFLYTGTDGELILKLTVKIGWKGVNWFPAVQEREEWQDIKVMNFQVS